MNERAIDCLENSTTSVEKVVYELSTLSAREKRNWEVFLTKYVNKLRESKNHMALFGNLNIHLTYLSPHLLRHLVKKLPPLNGIKQEMEKYMDALQKFRTETPLEVFCQINVEHVEQPDGFTDVVMKLEEAKCKNKPLTLQHVEDFRLKYANHYQLYDFALMLRGITQNCYIITFSVAESVVELLQTNVPKEILRDFGITEVVISGRCIFSEQNDTSQQMMIAPSPMETNPVSLLMETSAGICLWT